jgi:hypothetical protein
MKLVLTVLTMAAVAACSYAKDDESLPTVIQSSMPVGYKAASFVPSDFNGDGLNDFVVIATSVKEITDQSSLRDNSPKRWVLVYFGKVDGNELKYELVGQNDTVAFPANGGGLAGPCDPVFDQGDGLAAKGAYFTVENQVACGAHWTNYITFKYSSIAKTMVFENEIFESSGFDDKTGEFGVIKRSVKKAESKAILFKDYKTF